MTDRVPPPPLQEGMDKTRHGAHGGGIPLEDGLQVSGRRTGPPRIGMDNSMRPPRVLA